MLLPLLVFAQAEKKKALLFYSEECPHCKEVEEYFQKEKIYEKYEIRKIDISGEYNFSYLNDFFDSFKISQEKRGWPAIFFGDKILVGSRPIIENFVFQMEKSGTSEFPAPLTSDEYFSKIKSKLGDNKQSAQSLAVIVISTSLIDAINPCIFTTIFLLLFILWPSCIRSRFLFAMFGFLVAIFLIRLFSGIFLYQNTDTLNFFRSILIIMGITSATLGIFSLKYPLSSFSHAIYKMKIAQLSLNETIFLKGLAIGSFAGLFLLPNPIEPYSHFIKIISERFSQAKAIGILSLYNFLFIIPLVALAMGINLLAKKTKVREFYKKNIELVRVISGTIMVFIGIYIVRIIF